MNRNLLIGGVIVLLLAGGFFLLNSNKGNSRQPAPTTQLSPTPEAIKSPPGAMRGTGGTATPSGESMMQKGVKEFTAAGSNFKFSPSEIKVKKGDTVKITFKNTSGIHNLFIDEFNVATKTIQAGQEETVQFIADKAGTFEYYCSVGTHRAMGMVGKFIVEK